MCIKEGQSVAQCPGGPPVGKVQDYDPTTGFGTVVLNTAVPYGELENMGIPWSDFIDFD